MHTHLPSSPFFLNNSRYATAKIAARANTGLNPDTAGLADFAGVGVAIDIGRGESLDVGVGVTNGDGAVATADVGVGVEVIFATGVAVTRHIHVCKSDKPFVKFVVIAETFQVPMTALMFV